MLPIRQTYHIKASLSEVWKAFVDPHIISLWGGGPAVMSEKIGAHFSLWNGDIHGKNIEVVHHKKIVQEWFGGEWKEPSIVTFTFEDHASETIVHLHHINVPASEYDDIRDGWKSYYLGRIQKLFGRA